MKKRIKRVSKRWIIAMIAIPFCVLWIFFWLVAGPTLMDMIQKAFWTARR